MVERPAASHAYTATLFSFFSLSLSPFFFFGGGGDPPPPLGYVPENHNIYVGVSKVTPKIEVTLDKVQQKIFKKTIS